jgi:trimethylamine--corrinoid protein Co-methyltransferase
MKTTVFSYDAPEWRLADIALSQLSLMYGLPVFGTGGVTDAKTIDAQAGSEWAYSLLFSALAGTNLIHDVGYMESGLTGSLEALVICDEIIGMARRLLKGISLSPRDLCSDLIHEVGPAGSFLQTDHTLEHYRDDIWYPGVFDRRRFEQWESGGKADIERRASEIVAKLGLPETERRT